MGNLFCTDSTAATTDQAIPKSAARANGQVTSEPVVAKMTQPRPVIHSNNNGTAVVNGSSLNKQSSAPNSRQNSSSNVISVRTSSSINKQDSVPPSQQNSKSNTITIRTVSSTSKVNVSSTSKVNVSSSKVTPVSTSSVTTNGTARSGAEKRDSINTEIENNIENNDAIGNGSEQFNFPPVLEDFNLMDCDVDPTVLEDIFADDK